MICPAKGVVAMSSLMKAASSNAGFAYASRDDVDGIQGNRPPAALFGGRFLSRKGASINNTRNGLERHSGQPCDVFNGCHLESVFYQKRYTASFALPFVQMASSARA